MKSDTLWTAYFFGTIGLAVLGLSFALYMPYREKEVFNKYRPNTPAATYFDAVFSQLRVTTK